jgi:hypothetical protein
MIMMHKCWVLNGGGDDCCSSSCCRDDKNWLLTVKVFDSPHRPKAEKTRLKILPVLKGESHAYTTKVLCSSINTINMLNYLQFLHRSLCFPVHTFRVTDAKTAKNLMLIAFILRNNILDGAFVKLAGAMMGYLGGAKVTKIA